MMKKINRAISLLTAVAMTASLAACGGSPANETGTSTGGVSENSHTAAPAASDTTSAEPVTITFWNNFTAADGEVLQKIVGDFNANNQKQITVVMDIMPENNLTDKLPLAIASDTAPDFFAIGDAFFASFVAENTVVDLESFFAYEGVKKEDIMAGALGVGLVNEKQYFLPMTVNSFYLYWNKDLFAAAGLDPEKGPQTWEQLEEYAIKLTDSSSDKMGFGVPVRPQAGYNVFGSWALAYGGEPLSADQKTVTLNSPENLAVLAKMQNLIVTEKTGPAATALPDLMQMMIAGKVAMMVNGPWANSNLANNDVNYGISVLPHAEGKEPAAYSGGVGFAIPTTTDQAKYDAIYEFLKYWYSTEVHTTWITECNAIPFVISSTEQPEIQGNPVLLTMSKQIEYAKAFMPGNPQAVSVINDILNPMLESVQLGEDPAAVLERADKALQAMQ